MSDHALSSADFHHPSAVFLDGPIVLPPVDLPLDFGSLDRPPPIDAPTDPELIPRAWWRANEDRTVYQGVDDTLIYVRDFLKKQVAETGPFDVRSLL